MDDAELLTWTSLLTLQGATAAVLAITNVLGTVIGDSFNAVRKWLALVLSLLAGLAGLLTESELSLESWAVAILNGFMIAAAVLGVNETGSALAGRSRAATTTGGRSRFFQSWL